MAFDYGNQLEPGIVTNVESALTVTPSGQAPADAGLVGQADLGGGVDEGSADPNAVYQVTSAPDARDFFGEDSLLTDAVIDALDEGAYPVYAVAASEVTVSGEDLSGLSSNDGSLSEGPVSEVAEDTTFTINSSDLTTVVDFGDVQNETPGTDEVLLNPSTKEFHIDENLTVGNSGDSVSYSHYDYESANAAMENDAGGAIDFFFPLTENEAVGADVQTRAGNLASEYNFCLAVVGATPYIPTKADYANPYDDSRVQVIFPTRDEDGRSTLGSYAGLRASLGIRGTPINKNLETQKKLIESVPLNERGDLIENRVVPLAQEASGARVADDVNSVSDDNAKEANIRYGFSRLVMDYVLDVVREAEKPFIGRLNSYAIRKALEGLIRNQLRVLTRSNAIIDFDVRIKKVDATTAAMDLSVETAQPLRFIENTVTVGDGS